MDPKLLETYEKLGIPLRERAKLAGVAVDAVFDSVSVATTFREQLAKVGIIFCSFSEAVQNHPDLVKKYLGIGRALPDNFFATLNSAVFSDGSFCFIPKGVRCPMELSTYFRINSANTGQFERTLIVADEGAYVSYLEGCTAPIRDENQLHAAVVELVALDDAEIKYSTVQNWYPGDKDGKGGIYNFVTKRGACRGTRSKISWTQVETGSAITWKYPSCILQGDDSVGEFYSVAVTNNYQQADTGTKMIHIGKNTKSTIVSKGISAGHGQNTYRGMVKILGKADGARNYSQCDSLLIGDQCGAHTFPYIEVNNSTAQMEHEASTSKIGEDQIFYFQQRGISPEDAVNMIVNGFCKVVFKELPMEFAVEAQKLLGVSLRRIGGIRRRWISRLLEIRTSTPYVGGQGDPARRRPDGRPGRGPRDHGPNGSGKSTLAHVLAGRPGYTVTGARSSTRARTCSRWRPRSARREGVFLAFQYPVEIPGVSNVYFLKAALNAIRKHRGLPELDAMEFLALVKEKAKLVEIDEDLVKRPVNEGFSGGEKKRNEIFQMAVLDPSLAILDETDSGLDIDALRIVAAGVNQLRSAERSMIVVTHYQRLLNYIVPDFLHVLVEGRIVRSGGKELALELEEKGYAWLEKEPPAVVAARVYGSRRRRHEFRPEPPRPAAGTRLACRAAPRGVRPFRGARVPDAEERRLAIHRHPADHRRRTGPRGARARARREHSLPAGVRVRGASPRPCATPSRFLGRIARFEYERVHRPEHRVASKTPSSSRSRRAPSWPSRSGSRSVRAPRNGGPGPVSARPRPRGRALPGIRGPGVCRRRPLPSPTP